MTTDNHHSAELGDVVFYRDERGLQHAAIVTRVNVDDSVNLTVFPRTGSIIRFHHTVVRGKANEEFSMARDLHE